MNIKQLFYTNIMMELKSLYDCYHYIKSIDSSETQLKEDLVVGLHLLFCSNMNVYLQIMTAEKKIINRGEDDKGDEKNEKKNITESNKVKEIKENDDRKNIEEILMYLLDHINDEYIIYMIDNLCDFIINKVEITLGEKIILLNKLRKNKRFLQQLPKTYYWFYEDNAKKNEKSFLGYIIHILCPLYPNTFRNFLKKKEIKVEVIQWLYALLEQNEKRMQLVVEQTNVCTDHFMVAITEELLILYRNGKKKRRELLHSDIIYDKDYIFDFGQKRRNTNIYQEDRCLFNEYFHMCMKSIQLTFVCLINKNKNNIMVLKEIERQINDEQKKILYLEDDVNSIFRVVFIREKILHLTEEKNRLQHEIQMNNQYIQSNEYHKAVDFINDYLQINSNKIDSLTTKIIDICVTLLINYIDEESQNENMIVYEELSVILQKIMNETKFHYHSKSKVVNLCVSLNRMTIGKEYSYITLEMINTLQLFYIELGDKNIEEQERLEIRYNIFYLVNLFLNKPGNIDLYIYNYCKGSQNGDIIMAKPFIKFLHHTLCDLDTHVMYITTSIDKIKTIDELLDNENNTITVIQEKATRNHYISLIKTSIKVIETYLYYIKYVVQHSVNIFTNELLLQSYVKIMKYVTKTIMNDDVKSIVNNDIHFVCLYIGFILNFSFKDDILLKQFIIEGQSSIIHLCKCLVKHYLQNKEYNMKIMSFLILQLDINIDHLSKVEEMMVKESENDNSLVEIPDKFLDPIMMTLIKEPVELPSSSIIVDKSTILQHLLYSEEDPYSRKHLTSELLEKHNMKEDVLKKITEFKNELEEWQKKTCNVVI